ncbi:MAG: UDP-N-acetylglucosamine 2-epimerase (non-hydrolyzing) [Candidatus Hydrothermarchaeota archaeon]
MKALIVASTRPEVIKLAPLMWELERKGIDYIFATTGQPYDRAHFRSFVEELELRGPDLDIRIGSGSQAEQTSRAMVGLETLMKKEEPSVVIAEGDTNSVLSTALAAVKLHLPFAHVEAGLRSYDMRMPEEINRIVADHCSRVLFAPTEGSALNLVGEGIPPERVHIVGNTVVEATLRGMRKAGERSVKRYPKGYLLLTLHRAENVDALEPLRGILEALLELDAEVVFPVHPRTRERLERFRLVKMLEKGKITLIPPVGYLDFLSLLKNARAALTDSGGVQEEAITLHVPCITLRTTTERPESVTAGGNVLAGVKKGGIVKTLRSVLGDKGLYRRMRRAKNPFGDGKSGRRIVETLLQLHEDGGLEYIPPDFTRDLPRREFLTVDGGMDGKLIRELGMRVMRVIDGGRERFPRPGMRLRKGQILEVLRLGD